MPCVFLHGKLLEAAFALNKIVFSINFESRLICRTPPRFTFVANPLFSRFGSKSSFPRGRGKLQMNLIGEIVDEIQVIEI